MAGELSAADHVRLCKQQMLSLKMCLLLISSCCIPGLADDEKTQADATSVPQGLVPCKPAKLSAVDGIGQAPQGRQRRG